MLGRKPENILIIKTDGLTEFVAAEPVFAAIRHAHPKARISLLTQRHLQRVARAAPYFDQVAAMPNFRDAVARKAFVKQLRASKFACVYDLAANDDAKKLHAAMGPFRPKWHAAVPAPKRRKKLNATIVKPDVSRLAAEAGIEIPARLPDFHWALSARKDSANMKPSWFGVSGAFGLLLPGLDPERRWPASRYAEFARMLAGAQIMPVLIGPDELHAFADEITYLAPEIVDLSGKTDHLQFAALADEALFFVSDDAEELHLAVSVGCAGVIIKKAGQEGSAPEGRHVMTVTAKDDLADADPEFILRSLDNMGLIPQPDLRPHAASR